MAPRAATGYKFYRSRLRDSAISKVNQSLGSASATVIPDRASHASGLLDRNLSLRGTYWPHRLWLDGRTDYLGVSDLSACHSTAARLVLRVAFSRKTIESLRVADTGRRNSS